MNTFDDEATQRILAAVRKIESMEAPTEHASTLEQIAADVAALKAAVDKDNFLPNAFYRLCHIVEMVADKKLSNKAGRVFAGLASPHTPAEILDRLFEELGAN